MSENDYRLSKCTHENKRTIFEINGIDIGSGQLIIMAGPCAVESQKQIFDIAEFVSKTGANVLRGGTFKMRTSPYSFQGLGEEGLSYLQSAGKKFELATISEVTSLKTLDLVAKYVDILQIGTRNMYNFDLLKEAALTNKPILLKRAFSATYHDLLMAAEYILSSGNSKIILCERGIRTFENYTRNTLDIAAVPALRELTHLPVIVDPSHGTGKRNLVSPMAKAAIAAGADGIIVEVHPEPDKATSDAQQTIDLITFKNLVVDINTIKSALSFR